LQWGAIPTALREASFIINCSCHGGVRSLQFLLKTGLKTFAGFLKTSLKNRSLNVQ
jgi:hypothetical protein